MSSASNGTTAAPNPDRAAIRMLVEAGHVSQAAANEALNIAHGFSDGPLPPPPPPAAVAIEA